VTLALASTLLGVGLLSAFFAGLLGIGGALVMIPLLLYVPPLLGVGQLDIKAVAGITMAEVFVAALFGFGFIASTAVGIAKVLFWIFLILFILALIAGAMNGAGPPY